MKISKQLNMIRYVYRHMLMYDKGLCQHPSDHWHSGRGAYHHEKVHYISLFIADTRKSFMVLHWNLLLVATYIEATAPRGASPVQATFFFG